MFGQLFCHNMRLISGLSGLSPAFAAGLPVVLAGSSGVEGVLADINITLVLGDLGDPGRASFWMRDSMDFLVVFLASSSLDLLAGLGRIELVTLKTLFFGSMLCLFVCIVSVCMYLCLYV